MSPIKLTSQLARDAACKQIQAAPENYVVRISEATRTLEANAKLHAELQEIAGRLRWAGEFLEVEEWKRLMTAAWMRATNRKMKIIPSVDGHGYDILYQRTSTLGKSEMNELIEYILAWKADRPEFAYIRESA